MHTFYLRHYQRYSLSDYIHHKPSDRTPGDSKGHKQSSAVVSDSGSGICDILLVLFPILHILLTVGMDASGLMGLSMHQRIIVKEPKISMKIIEKCSQFKHSPLAPHILCFMPVCAIKPLRIDIVSP